MIRNLNNQIPYLNINVKWKRKRNTNRKIIFKSETKRTNIQIFHELESKQKQNERPSDSFPEFQAVTYRVGNLNSLKCSFFILAIGEIGVSYCISATIFVVR